MQSIRLGRKLLDSFERIYVLILATRRDRLIDVNARLERIGLAFQIGRVERFDACSFEEPASSRRVEHAVG
jgi:hypothetical protein